MKLRTLSKIIAGIVVLILIALVAIPFFIPTDYLKAQLIAQVKNATGRDLVINGRASLALFPTIAVSVEDVTLGNPAGFVSPYFMHIDKLKTGAALKPLLAGQLSITGITLDGMQLNLEQNKAGAKNWEFTLAKAKAQTQENIARKESSAPSPTNFSVGDTAVKNSTITYMQADAKPLVAREINLTLTGADGGKPLTLDGKLRYQDEAVDAHLVVDQLKALLGGDSTAVNASLTLPYASSVSFVGNAGTQNGVTAAGALNVQISDLPKLMAWATGKPAAAGMPKQVALDTKLAVAGLPSVALTDLSLHVDTLAAKGRLAANLAVTVPAISGSLQIADLDLKALTEGNVPAAPAAAAPSPTRVDGWSDAAIDASGLRAVNATLGLAIDTLRSDKLLVTKLALNAELKNGVLKLNLANASLYDGTAKGTVTLDGSGAVPALATNIALSGIRIDPLMTALSGTSRLQGTTNLALSVTGRGASQRAIVASLNGNGSLNIANGAFKGVNIAQFLRNVKQGSFFGDGNNAASTGFSELSASFTLAQGIATNKDLAMKSPILQVAGSGTVNLPARTVNYRLVPTIVGSQQQGSKQEATGLAVPLLITGPWSNPGVMPDVAGMLQQGLKDPAALKQNLKGIGGALKNLNSPKDLGKALFGQ